jgi:hypothetical protein
MAKGKYQEWLEPDGLLKLEGWARDGLTDEQIAKNMGIVTKTLYEWKNKYSAISEALKRGKEVIDIEVENALLNKAMGFKVMVKKSYKVKDVEYDNGRKVKESERIEMVDEEQYIPPDTTAQIFWLKNRKPAEWRDKQNIEHTGKDGETLKVELTGDIATWAK